MYPTERQPEVPDEKNYLTSCTRVKDNVRYPMPRHRLKAPSTAKGSQEASQSLPPRLVHGISVLRPSVPEGCSIVDEDLTPSFDLLRCLKHHVELSRTIHANEESQKELGIDC